MEIDSLSCLTALSHPHRLAVFRLLMRRFPDEVAAGDLSGALGVKPSTMSVYLSALSDAHLISQKRVGTSLRYRANTVAAGDLVDFLFNECCRGRPELCPPQGTAPGTMCNVLFVCTGNSARSQFCEAILRDVAGARFNAFSAGTKPGAAPNPLAMEMLALKGHDISLLRSKHISDFLAEDAPKMDFVFTVCDHAANEDCPAWKGQPISGHWGLPDPARAQGSAAERRLAFQQSYGAISNRIRAFAALPLDALTRISLQTAVDRIGAGEPEGLPT